MIVIESSNDYRRVDVAVDKSEKHKVAYMRNISEPNMLRGNGNLL